MKNIKSITLGIIIGAAATLSITALAEYIVVPNSFPVKVNGQTVQVEGYNINDSTYFKLRDVADVVGGFEVGFENNAIIVNTPSQPTPAPTTAPTAKPDLSPLPELPIERRNGKEYVSAIDVNDMLKNIGLDKYSIIGHDFYNNDNVLNPLMKDIPLYEVDLIPLDYYTATLVPFINSLR